MGFAFWHMLDRHRAVGVCQMDIDKVRIACYIVFECPHRQEVLDNEGIVALDSASFTDANLVAGMYEEDMLKARHIFA